ncbi:MAG: aminotransferase class III-fold pyridoxal phosphate-dependent enzyme [Bacillota bacterium]|nr:aminotransferase class III-fold pyridoxal phosphate-dependent enzyme [Bacillota bacterium]HOP70828.1 aminotransferase class III-fold pyridoxal phosphate-dependent enzyme [Bacillota bacterium]HPT36218.1 aminotransferase class III-fold pyridoxal phosphate-dependent enzyme [Bacillota bacterium]HQD85949.1 aminotransferase class III-fold pyridoxal phosphate-dependent enzyme [Bacillota bacterium]
MADRNTYGLLGLDKALNLSRKEAGDLFAKHVNPGLKTMLSAIGFDKNFVRAEGIFVYDDAGTRYLDFLGGYGSLPFGHNPKDVLAGVEKASSHPNFLQARASSLQAALAHDLAAILPGDLSMAFFCNSGAESVEGALKMARIATGKQVFIHCTGAFHGKTLGALSVGGREKYKTPFQPLIPGCVEVPFGDIRALEQALDQHRCAAVIMEPVQGEAGVIVPPEGYLKQVRELTDAHDTLLILDEVQTGLGRTGTMFACEHEGVVPDIMCLAKALGGGVMPLGATVATRKVWEKAYGGLSKAVLHTSTFGGGARACAAGLVTISKLVEENLAERARDLGEYFLNGLRTLQKSYKTIKEVRGKGLLIGLEFDKPVEGLLDKLTAGAINEFAKEYYASLVAGELLGKHQVITAYTLNNPNVMRLEPPLTVTKDQIDYVLNALEDIFSQRKGLLRMALSVVTKKP